MPNAWWGALLALALSARAPGAGAQWLRAGRLDDSIPRSDVFGNSFAGRPLGFDLNYYGTVSDQAVVCTHGYVVLGGLAPAGGCILPYVELGDSLSRVDELGRLRAAYGSVMAPDFSWANTYLRPSVPPDTNGQIFTSTDPVGGRAAWSATWDAVRDPIAPNDGRLTFQLALIRLGAGSFVMEFNYGALGWLSEGGAGWVDDGSFTGRPVRGQAFAPGVIPSNSRFACLFVDGAAQRCAANVDLTAVPEPGTAALLAGGLAVLGAAAARRRVL